MDGSESESWALEPRHLNVCIITVASAERTMIKTISRFEDLTFDFRVCGYAGAGEQI